MEGGTDRMSEKINMDIYVPLNLETDIVKNDDGEEEEKWFVRGYASTPDLDMQGEIVQPSGIDIDYFVKSGWVNYEHKQEAEFKVGAPTDNCYIDMNKGLFVEAILFKDNKHAQSMWELANNLSKEGIDRNLGFSIEGYVNKRNDTHSNVIEDIVIRNVAITTNPANTEATWENFVAKTWEAGTETNPAMMVDGGALAVENLAQAITVLTSQLKHLEKPQEDSTSWVEVAKFLDKSEKSNRDNGILLLQLSEGLSREESTKYIENKME